MCSITIVIHIIAQSQELSHLQHHWRFMSIKICSIGWINMDYFLILLQFLKEPNPVAPTVMVNATTVVPVRVENSIALCTTSSAPSWTQVTAVAIKIMKDQPRTDAKLQLSKDLVLSFLNIFRYSNKYQSLLFIM